MESYRRNGKNKAKKSVRRKRGNGQSYAFAAQALRPPATGRDRANRSTSTRVVRRRELIGTYTFAAGDQFMHPLWQTSVTLINPGNEFLFPWGSRLATLYEKYRFESLAFEAISRNPTTCPGGVYMAVDTDPNDPLPVDMAELMHNRNAVSGSAWQNLRLNVDIRTLNEGMPWRFTSPYESPDAWEPRTSFCGRVLFAGNGATATYSQTYDLYSDYTLVLNVEQLPGRAHQTFVKTQGTVPGATFYQNPTTLTSMPGAAKLVQEAVGTTPIFTGGLGTVNFYNPKLAVDVGGIRNGTVEYQTTMADAGLTPYGLLPAGSLADLAVYDELGAYLGSADDLTTKSTLHGALRGSTWVAGQNASAMMSFAVEDLFALYPRARYLIPYVYSTAVTAITTLGHSLTVRDAR